MTISTQPTVQPTTTVTTKRYTLLDDDPSVRSDDVVAGGLCGMVWGLMCAAACGASSYLPAVMAGCISGACPFNKTNPVLRSVTLRTIDKVDDFLKAQPVNVQPD